MPKKKLSRDQKRKLKKQKRKQRKKIEQNSAKTSQKTQRPVRRKLDEIIEVTPPSEVPVDYFDEQEERLRQVFGSEEVPSVEADTLRTYFNYIQENIELPCLLTGIESMGYFGWEERFEFGYGSKSDYEKIRDERGSYHDQYELNEFDGEIEPGWDIWVDVKRTSDDKQFTIPLSELEAVDKTSSNYELLNDYTVWIVNWR